MGYWSQNEEGASFAEADSGEEMVWGDQPADIIDGAIGRIKAVFVMDIGRLPTKKELMAGITFSTRALDDLPDTVAEAEAKGLEVLGEDWNDGNPYPMPGSDRANAYARDYYKSTRGDVSTPPDVIEASRRVREVIASLTPEKEE